MDALELLLSRTSAVRLESPGPSKEDLDTMLRAAVRAPDHGRLRPWRFVIIPEDQREAYGDRMAELLSRRDPDISPAQLDRERQKALRAPVILVVAARIVPSEKVPAIEQTLSAGTAAQNVLLAAHALGYGAVWKTGAAAYDAGTKRLLGLHDSDAIVGFLYIGTNSNGLPDPQRPDPAEFTSTWRA